MESSGLSVVHAVLPLQHFVVAAVFDVSGALNVDPQSARIMIIRQPYWLRLSWGKNLPRYAPCICTCDIHGVQHAYNVRDVPEIKQKFEAYSCQGRQRIQVW